MYKAAVRALVRRGIREMNAGHPDFVLKLVSPQGGLAFPGDNSWAAMFRPVVKGREAHVTHRGRDECRAFADRLVATGIQLDIADILVNGPPWRTRVAVRCYDSIAGSDEYQNRVLAFIEISWGRIVRWEDYLDTERLGAWDRAHAAEAAGV